MKLIDLETDRPAEGVVRVTIARPAVKGTYRGRAGTELIAVLNQFAADDSLCAMVLAGTDNAFHAGGDITGTDDIETAHRGPLGHAMLIRDGLDQPPGQCRHAAEYAVEVVNESADAAAGIAVFRQRRKPVPTGR